MKRLLVTCAVVCLAVVMVLQASAQVKKGKTRLATTHQLMEGLVAANCKALGEDLKSTPADEKAWKHLATKAALLNEASYILMDDGRCPDAVWAGATTKLREGSAELLTKLEAQDADGAKAAMKSMTQSCGECHKAHKK